MIKKQIALLIIGLISIFSISCQKTENVIISGESAMTSNSLLTIEDFKEQYNLEDSEITDDMIEGYILEYNVDREKMEKENLLENLNLIVNVGYGDALGYNLGNLFKGVKETKAPLKEFISDSRLIYIKIFGMSSTSASEFAMKEENMVIDLKHKKIYFNAKENDYRQAKICADLNESCLIMIQDELPMCLSNRIEGETSCLDYDYTVIIMDNNKNVEVYDCYVDNQTNVKFDNFWKSIYFESFGMEYERNN